MTSKPLWGSGFDRLERAAGAPLERFAQTRSARLQPPSSMSSPSPVTASSAGWASSGTLFRSKIGFSW